jgi:hypothetical protein
MRHRRSRPVRLISVLLPLLALVACRDPAPVHVQAQLAPEFPLGELDVVAVPFSTERLLDSLERAAPRRRPTFPDLEARMRRFTPGSPEQPDTSLTLTWKATRDSVARMADRLRSMDRGAPAYREAYNRFRDLYQRYTARAAAREAALRAVLADDRRLAQEAGRAADSLRAWEREAYREFPRLAESRVRQAGRPLARAETDSAGRATLELTPGDWWLSARFTHPENPFIEYRWNVPVRVAGLPFALPLTPANAQPGWRH